jgi:hypothetical protein
MKNLLLQKFHQVLEIVAVNGVRTLSELSAELDIPLPTLSRLISDMTEMNLLEKIDHYRVAPAPGLIRLGECAKMHSRNYQLMVPEIRKFSEKMQMNTVLAGMENEIMFNLFSNSLPRNHVLTPWENGLKPVLLTMSGVPAERCLQLFSEAHPGISFTERMILERELESVAREKKIFRTNTVRQWSWASAFVSRRMWLGICFYGNAVENCSRERFDIECSMLTSRIMSAINEE